LYRSYENLHKIGLTRMQDLIAVAAIILGMSGDIKYPAI
jgi:hypothetical protein